MTRFVFNGETIGDTADNAMSFGAPSFAGQGADEVVEYVRGAHVSPFDRENAGLTVSFSVAQSYGTLGDAMLACALRNEAMERQATLDMIVVNGGETVTLRMKNALRRPLKARYEGLTVFWDFEFVGGRFVEVASAVVAFDYSGGVANSGDAFTRFFWGGVCGDGAGVTVDWARDIEGGVIV